MKRYLTEKRDKLRSRLEEPRLEERHHFTRLDSLDVFGADEDHVNIVDFHTGDEHLPVYQRVWKWLVEEQSWIFLLVLGTVGAFMVLFLDFSLEFTSEARMLLSSLVSNQLASMLIWLASGCFFGVLAVACVHVVSPHAAGSGIPEMKTVLSGMDMSHYLSFRTLVAKSLGIVCSWGAGLSVGKEGPYVHICSILAHQLAQLRIFRRVSSNSALRLQVIGAGCALGVAATFGAPLGGVLFAIEVTSTYYLVAHLWKGFFCTVCASLVVRTIGTMGLVSLFNTEFDTLPYSPWELLLFAAMGVGFGFLSVIFIKFVAFISRLKKQYRVLSPEFRYTQVLVSVIVINLISFAFVYLRNDDSAVEINDLFEAGDMKIVTSNVWLHLTIFGVLKFIFTGIHMLLPVAAGGFTPIFTTGAALGRLVGEMIPGVVRGGYAVVGAAAFAGGVTRSLSTAMIMFELTGQLHYMLPVTLAVLISCAIANIWTVSLYDTLLEAKQLPFMPMYSSKSAGKNVGSVMEPIGPVVVPGKSYNHLIRVLNGSPLGTLIPCCTRDMQFIGCMQRKQAMQFIQEREELFASQAGADRHAFFEEEFVLPRDQLQYGVLQMPLQTPLAKAHFMFSLLSPKLAMVSNDGSLIGVLTKERLIDFIRND